VADNITVKRAKRKTKTGVVISDKMNKTAVVKVTRHFKHPSYGKIVKRTCNVKIHDENNECKIGDVVEIMETRHISKDKWWRFVRLITSAQ